ncbi:MAG: UDP-N-acetylglucosamine 2-epimerase, partial [Planctomycetes bacterium]|nr:UDP-N-acetylglucosamine 2-epimerase [Planctomycetota bacterium]
LGLAPRQYVLVTLHRPTSVDEPRVMADLIGVLDEIQRDLPVVFPIHPRTRKSIETNGLTDRVRAMPRLKLTEPLGYLDFLRLMMDARGVLTDSRGIQAETTILGVPCLTIRENTERPITLTQGTNQLVGLRAADILAAYRAVAAGGAASPRRPEKWDGHAAERIADIIAGWSH